MGSYDPQSPLNSMQNGIFKFISCMGKCIMKESYPPLKEQVLDCDDGSEGFSRHTPRLPPLLSTSEVPTGIKDNILTI